MYHNKHISLCNYSKNRIYLNDSLIIVQKCNLTSRFLQNFTTYTLSKRC